MHQYSDEISNSHNHKQLGIASVGMAVVVLQNQQKKLLKWAIFSMTAIVIGLVTSNAIADENLYQKNYKAQNAYGLKSSQTKPDTQMFVSNHKEEDNISMLEKGYDLMGSSGFKSGDVSPDLALQHGKSIQADVVLVYTKYGSQKTSHSKLEMIKEAAKKGKALTEKDVQDEPTEYQYFASYWAKMPTPTLGVHVIKLIAQSDDEEEAKKASQGLSVVAVIQDSPAAKAGLVRGDKLIKINNITLEKPEELSAIVRKFKGKSIEISLVRDNVSQTSKATLN